MIKKFLSLIALSATLISPALADEFVPLQYYDDEPPVRSSIMSFDKRSEIERMTDDNKNNKKSSSTADWSNKKEQDKDIDWCEIRDDLARDNTRSLEEVIDDRSMNNTFKSNALEDILLEMRIGNTNRALEIFDENFHYCASALLDEPYKNDSTAGCFDTYCSGRGKNAELFRELEGETAKNTGKNIGKQKKGKPATNTAQNKQVNDAARAEKLTHEQRKKLGKEVEKRTRKDGENLDYHDIRDIARDIKDGVY